MKCPKCFGEAVNGELCFYCSKCLRVIKYHGKGGLNIWRL